MSQFKNITALCLCIFAFFFIIRSSEYSRLLTSIELKTYEYPTVLNPNTIHPIISGISSEEIESNLIQLINDLPKDRYYKSENGYNSALYVKQYLEDLTAGFKGNQKIEIRLFEHSWKQPSVILKVKGKSSKSIIIGCHIDSINFKFFDNAPGVDDNLSGVVTVFQTTKHLVDAMNKGVIELENSVEFHFYAAEEVGSIGSADVMKNYHDENIEVIAMLQQDMTGYITKSIESGEVEHFGIITDYVSTSLMNFTKLIIENYCTIPYLETQCGKVCSDHISGLMYGYPSVYVLESKVELSNPFIHSAEDTIDKVNFEHMREHTKLTVAFTIELAISKSVEMTKERGNNDHASFRYIDFLVLLMMHHTRTFVYAVVLFAASLSTMYIIILDSRSAGKAKDANGKIDDDSQVGEAVSKNNVKGKKGKKQV